MALVPPVLISPLLFTPCSYYLSTPVRRLQSFPQSKSGKSSFLVPSVFFFEISGLHQFLSARKSIPYFIPSTFKGFCKVSVSILPHTRSSTMLLLSVSRNEKVLLMWCGYVSVMLTKGHTTTSLTHIAHLDVFCYSY